MSGQRKESLRQEILSQRQKLTPQQIQTRSSSVLMQLASWLDSKATVNTAGEKKVFGLYFPIRGEVDVLPLFSFFQQFDAIVAFPKIGADKSMRYLAVNQIAELRPTKFGLCEPLNGQEVIPEIALIPGVAFSTACHRLGYGQGYFDRYFSQHAGVSKLGLAYDFQILAEGQRNEELFEPHDVRLDAVITETKQITR